MSGITVNGDVRAYFAYDDEANPGVGVYHPIGKITSISGFDNTKEMIDVTSFDTSVGYRDFIPALKDAGSVKMTFLFTKEDYNLILHNLIPLGRWKYQVVVQEGTLTWAEWLFEGEFTEIGQTIPIDDKISVEYTVKIHENVSFVIH